MYPEASSGPAQLQPVQDLTAFVLAGGKSSRMGRDKAFLELGGQTLLEHALILGQSIAHEVVIVGEVTRFMRLGRAIEDVYPGHGPLGGIHAALLSTATALNLILAVDMPLVERDFLLYLVAEATRSGAMVTVPRSRAGWQPLCAVYHRDFGEIAERALQAGKNKIDPLFSRTETRAISQAELVRMGFSETMFRNLNTPDEFARAEKELAAAGPRRN
jgi:molybdenum cofactor guanylyltransferase